MILEKGRELWATWGFEIFLGTIVFFLLLFGLIHYFRGDRGTWSKSVEIQSKAPAKRRPPTLSRGEAECRRVLESIFQKPFSKVRPFFLKNPIGDMNFEIDCYNPELKLGCEYNGIQHSKYIPFFHKNIEAFKNQQYRDHIKMDLCEKNGIRLIIVPHTVKERDIEKYIVQELERFGVNLS